MHATINQKCLADMVNTLENDEIGAAIRLLSRILATGRPVPSDRARAICQMTPEAWDVSRASILEHFQCDADAITHTSLVESSFPAVAGQSRARVGTTGEMPLVQPTRGQTVPAYTTREKPEIVSIKRTAYLIMEEVFERSEQSKNTARAVLAGLLKRWPEGDVYKAVSDAGRQQYLVDPRSWIVAHLQKNSKPVVTSRSQRETCEPPQKAGRRDIVTPSSVGVSTSTADRIRERNAKLNDNTFVRKG